ncbi:MAG: hypothetical protein OCD02_14060 [Spirochaetaceae bacterium]
MEIQDLKSIIHSSEQKLSAELIKTWDDIKISPALWVEASNGKFWAVAIMADEVIWYNHIEGGFNVSTFKTYGEISEYWNENTYLHDLLWHLF